MARLWGSSLSSLFLSDEELGKKDDDRKPSVKAATATALRPANWNPARVAPRKTFRRLALALVLGICVYLFVANIPTDVPIRDHRRPVYDHFAAGGGRPHPPSKPDPLAHLRPRPDASHATTDADYPFLLDTPVRFPKLADTLRQISATRGGLIVNKNVLWAAASLKSAATLLPMACQMGRELRSYVHFALMSRSDVSVDELRAINGIDDSCQIIFHDARTDHPAGSSESRLKGAVVRALYHINGYMHPQAILIDGSGTEELYLLEAMREQAPAFRAPLIELPEYAPTRLAWMTKLDSASLSAWNKVNIDILVQALPGSSGSLIRLLRSLAAADYTSCAIPHLTIELPHDADPPTVRFLETFQWPPADVYNPSNARYLSLRYRLKRTALTEEESSVRFLESFWPANPENSHVLVLSPHAELSPEFISYLKYSILEYKYSHAAIEQDWGPRLFGISLDLPSTHLDASEPFTPPLRKNPIHGSVTPAKGPSSFLWQAPNSNAVLILGQKWVELHGFVSRLLEAQHRSKPGSSEEWDEKLVSKKWPAWLEHVLKLSRARGYWTLYPSQMTAKNLAAVHSDLYQAPEEYEGELATADTTAEGPDVTLDTTPLLDSLPDGGNLPPFDALPLLLWDGMPTTLADLDEAAAEYTTDFRRTIGGCDDLVLPNLLLYPPARDLFCDDL